MKLSYIYETIKLTWVYSSKNQHFTLYWNIYQSIQSYIKQPVSLLGYNMAQSWKYLLWPGCGKWNGQHNAAILVDSSTVLAQHGLCLTPETIRLLKCSEMSKINYIGYCHKTGMAEVVKPSLWLIQSTKLCKEAIFWLAISSFKTQWVRCSPTRSATMLIYLKWDPY